MGFTGLPNMALSLFVALVLCAKSVDFLLFLPVAPPLPSRHLIIHELLILPASLFDVFGRR